MTQHFQQQAEAASQSTAQKVVTMSAGIGGIGLKFVDIATFAQQLGMIVGCILVCGQLVVFAQGQAARFMGWLRRRRAANANRITATGKGGRHGR